MTDLEYQVLDELYFVSSFPELENSTGLSYEQLVSALAGLVRNGYVKILYPDQDTELPFAEDTFSSMHTCAYYLATKAGLLAHNSL